MLRIEVLSAATAEGETSLHFHIQTLSESHLSLPPGFDSDSAPIFLMQY